MHAFPGLHSSRSGSKSSSVAPSSPPSLLPYRQVLGVLQYGPYTPRPKVLPTTQPPANRATVVASVRAAGRPVLPSRRVHAANAGWSLECLPVQPQRALQANSRPFRGKGFGLVLRSKLLRPCRISAAAAQHGGGDGDDEAGEEDEYNLQPLFPVPPPAATTQVVYPCMVASRMCCTPGRCRSMGARLSLTTVGDPTLRPSYLSTRQVRLDILIEAGPDGIPCE